MQVDVTLEIERNDICFEFALHYYVYEGHPGVIYAPPERCYPPEPTHAELEEIITVHPVKGISFDKYELEVGVNMHPETAGPVDWSSLEEQAILKAELHEE